MMRDFERKPLTTHLRKRAVLLALLICIGVLCATAIIAFSSLSSGLTALWETPATRDSAGHDGSSAKAAWRLVLPDLKEEILHCLTAAKTDSTQSDIAARLIANASEVLSLRAGFETAELQSGHAFQSDRRSTKRFRDAHTGGQIVVSIAILDDSVLAIVDALRADHSLVRSAILLAERRANGEPPVHVEFIILPIGGSILASDEPE